MPDTDFTFDLANIVEAAIRVGVIIALALVVQTVAKRLVRRMIALRIPRIREEEPGQLALRSDTLSHVVIQLVRVVVWLFAGVMVLSEVGIAVTPLLGAIGLVSLALGFAAQNIIRDYLHGFYIVMEDWYRVGEVVIIAGIGGLVESMSLRRTVLRDLDGVMHSIPNSRVELASNVTRDLARINLNVEVAYGENLDRVIAVINEVCAQLKEDQLFGPDLLTTPKVEGVDKLGASGIEIKILGDTKPMRQWALTRELRKRIKDRFDQDHIEIPWPHTKVYFGNEFQGKERVSGKEASVH